MTEVEILEDTIVIEVTADKAAVAISTAAEAVDQADKAVVVPVDKVEEDKHQCGNEAICQCANENSSLNMDDDYEPNSNATMKLLLSEGLLWSVALFIVQNNSKQVKRHVR